MPVEDLSPADIRSLRGDRTRAAFAQIVGVNAHTVYRWELPDGSPHARRPRGEVRTKLKALASALPDPAVVPVLAAIERALDGRGRDAENVLLRAQGDRLSGVEVRAMAATGLALIELVYRADGRRALAALAPALAPDAPASALAEAAAALAYSMPDGELFDLGHVHAHAQRVDELADPGDAPVAYALAAIAVGNAALLAGDDDLMVRAIGRVEAIAGAALPELVALFLEQLRAYAAACQGNEGLGLDRLDRILANPVVKQAPALEARVAAARAMRSLGNLGDPEESLALARHAREVAAAGQIATGVHSALALRAEGEALFRLGRLAECDVVFAESDRILDVLRFPVSVVLPVQIRFLQIMERADALEALAAKIAAIDLPSMRALCQAYAAWISAMAAFTRGDDAAGTMAAFAHAERLASGWSILRRDVLTAYANVAIVDGATDEASAIVERARRAADRRPSAWVTAHLRRVEAMLHLGEGRLDEGRTLLEAACATLEASGDRVAAALGRYGAAALARTLGADDGAARLRAGEEALAAIGLPRPRWIDRALARVAPKLVGQHHVPRIASPVVVTPGLELGLQRVAAPGATFTMVAKELAAVGAELAGAPVVIEEDGGRRLCRATATAEVVAWFEVVDVAPRIRLGVTHPLDDAQQAALRVLLVVGGLALKLAGLRGGERPATAPEIVVPDVPGLVAASPVMRRLLADVSQLASSRATVTITGESGAGKEVIARALHELSPRVQAPYVAFNCAAVPRDLFEGQLFGYKKGAFTGATADHPGVIRAADGGTLFLDEIGELPLDIQPKLLRFLDAGEVFPLGAQRAATVDVRVIAATNRDLAAEVARGRFRQDLFYRLQVVPLAVPPLRERRDDIAPLARHFARLIAGDRPPTFAPDALAALRAHPWPGNARELRNVIERALAYGGNSEVLTRASLGL